MATRYGGKYSPDGSKREPAIPTGKTAQGLSGGAPGSAKRPFDGKRRSRAGVRTNLLFFTPIPLIFKAFRSEPVVMAQYLGAGALILLGAWLTREGLIAQEAFEARRVARAPAFPRKAFGALCIGAGLGLVGIAGHGIIEAVIFAALGFGLHLFAFGLDPMRSKGIEGIDTFQQDRVARAVDEGEKHLAAMRDAILRARDRGVEARLDQFMTTARDMFRTVEQDPRDLTAARKYLGVYLLGARDASIKFADIYERGRDAQARADYLALLDDLEANFAARTEAFLKDDKGDLDIEIEVLRERLAREGITAKNGA